MEKISAINKWMCVLLIVFTSCNSSSKFDIDVSDSSLEIKIKRFERDMFSLTTKPIPEKATNIQEKYGSFANLFANQIINVGPFQDTVIPKALYDFMNDQDIENVFSQSQLVFPEMTGLSDQLTDAFRRYAYYFPSRKVPQVVTFISGFNYAIIASDSTLGIGLDMYLGKDYEYYFMLRYPEYKRRNMVPEAIASDCIRGWLTSEYVNDSQGSLVNQMIYYGKVLYAMDAILPKMNDFSKIGFTEEELLWCETNESNIWAFCIDNNLLYSTDPGEITKYIGEAPFTAGFSKDSPGRTGWWLGWQIVRSYMASHSEISIQELMAFDDEQKLLTASNYKPRR